MLESKKDVWHGQALARRCLPSKCWHASQKPHFRTKPYKRQFWDSSSSGEHATANSSHSITWQSHQLQVRPEDSVLWHHNGGAQVPVALLVTLLRVSSALAQLKKRSVCWAPSAHAVLRELARHLFNTCQGSTPPNLFLAHRASLDSRSAEAVTLCCPVMSSAQRGPQLRSATRQTQ